MPSYITPAATVSCEQVIKSSRFVCNLGHAASKDQARAEIDHVRQQHPRANHVCWAYIAGQPDSAERAMNDDGEPHGTAGKPILARLSHSGYGEIWTSVTRYFGGIKLGTGGLVRAYGSSVQLALDLVETRTRETMLPCRITFDYSFLSIIEPVLLKERAEILERTFTQQVSLDLLIPETGLTRVQTALTDLSGGTVQLANR